MSRVRLLEHKTYDLRGALVDGYHLDLYAGSVADHMERSVGVVQMRVTGVV